MVFVLLFLWATPISHSHIPLTSVTKGFSFRMAVCSVIIIRSSQSWIRTCSLMTNLQLCLILTPVCFGTYIEAASPLYYYHWSLQLCLTLCDPLDYILQAHHLLKFSRQEYWVVAVPSQGILPNPGIKRISSYVSCIVRVGSFTTKLPWGSPAIYIDELTGN